MAAVIFVDIITVTPCILLCWRIGKQTRLKTNKLAAARPTKTQPTSSRKRRDALNFRELSDLQFNTHAHMHVLCTFLQRRRTTVDAKISNSPSPPNERSTLKKLKVSTAQNLNFTGSCHSIKKRTRKAYI